MNTHTRGPPDADQTLPKSDASQQLDSHVKLASAAKEHVAVAPEGKVAAPTNHAVINKGNQVEKQSQLTEKDSNAFNNAEQDDDHDIITNKKPGDPEHLVGSDDSVDLTDLTKIKIEEGEYSASEAEKIRSMNVVEAVRYDGVGALAATFEKETIKLTKSDKSIKNKLSQAMSKLEKDPFQTPISCGSSWGGAMGPAQFIPSTWKLFISRLQIALGHYPNPWQPEDAFMASSLYLTDLGAVGNSASAQIKAACKYYGSGGTTCSYGNSVMALKAKIQANIDLL